MTQRLTSYNVCGSVTYISWSIDFAFYHCHGLKLFLYIKKWRWPGVFVSLQELALIIPVIVENRIKILHFYSLLIVYLCICMHFRIFAGNFIRK